MAPGPSLVLHGGDRRNTFKNESLAQSEDEVMDGCNKSRTLTQDIGVLCESESKGYLHCSNFLNSLHSCKCNIFMPKLNQTVTAGHKSKSHDQSKNVSPKSILPQRID